MSYRPKILEIFSFNLAVNKKHIHETFSFVFVVKLKETLITEQMNINII